MTIWKMIVVSVKQFYFICLFCYVFDDYISGCRICSYAFCCEPYCEVDVIIRSYIGEQKLSHIVSFMLDV